MMVPKPIPINTKSNNNSINYFKITTNCKTNKKRQKASSPTGGLKAI